MSAATPFTASSTSSTSRSRTLSTGSEPNPLSALSALSTDSQPQPQPQPRSRFAWCVTGSGHFLDESMALAARLPNVDLFLSAAGEEVLEIYKLPVEGLKSQFRVLRDKTASGVPVGMLYDDVYHTVVIAPATSNTVAKCAFGISDSLPTNMFAQAGKLGIPGIVFACDTEAVVVTRSPHDWVTLRPRRVELDNVERLRAIDFCQVVASPAELEAALGARLKELSLAWNTSSS
ncbi:MAG: dihydromethanopterin reductase [Rhizobacter sp.]|nr:dihydromethanopterin reductase [Rhizobacter sp.]